MSEKREDPKTHSRRRRSVYQFSHAQNETITTSAVKKGYSNSGVKMINDFETLETLGKGSYGKVKLVRNVKDQNNYAIKVISRKVLAKKRVGMSGNALQDVFREIAILKKLHHPNIVSLYEVIDDPEHEKIYMVFEYVKGGAVRQGVVEQEPLPISVCWAYFRDIILGLEYVHSQNVIHRDIKPENLLLDEDGSLKISDFGVSCMVESDDETLRKTAGSPAFLAPETCTGEEFEGRPVDLWAVGVTLYVFVFGRCPFVAKSSLQIYNVIKTEEVSFPYDVDPDLKDLFLRLLDKNPRTRITIPEIRVHPWMTKRGTCLLPAADDVRLSVSMDEIEKAVGKSGSIGKKLKGFFGGKKKEKEKDKDKEKKEKEHKRDEPAASAVASETATPARSSGGSTIQIRSHHPSSLRGRPGGVAARGEKILV